MLALTMLTLGSAYISAAPTINAGKFNTSMPPSFSTLNAAYNGELSLADDGTWTATIKNPTGGETKNIYEC